MSISGCLCCFGADGQVRPPVESERRGGELDFTPTGSMSPDGARVMVPNRRMRSWFSHYACARPRKSVLAVIDTRAAVVGRGRDAGEVSVSCRSSVLAPFAELTKAVSANGRQTGMWREARIGAVSRNGVIQLIITLEGAPATQGTCRACHRDGESIERSRERRPSKLTILVTVCHRSRTRLLVPRERGADGSTG